MSEADQVPSGVNRQLWLEALEMADGDRARVEIRSATSLVVHNTADWKPAPAKAPRAASKAAPKAAADAKAGTTAAAPTAGTTAERPTATVTAIPPTPEWTSAAPARARQHTHARPKSDVPAFLAPASGGLR